VSTAADRALARACGIALSLSPSFVPLVLPTATFADVAPEAGLLVHVQPVSSGWDWCFMSPITDCHQIVRSTPQDGEVEFLLFFMTGSLGWGSETFCLESLHTVLTWPPAWQLVAFEPCAPDGSLDPGGTTHALDLSWWGYPYPVGDAQGDVVPVARLVMNVVGPGRLGFTSWAATAELRHSCSGSTFVTLPVQVYAEAGMECGHISAHCAYWEGFCEPYFDVSELVLRAPTGGAADSSFVLRVGPFWASCPVTAETHAPWCAASVEFLDEEHRRLHVTADASGLSPGMYETRIEVAGGSHVSRCLPTTFIVQEPTATSTTSWGRVKALYR